MGSIRYTFNRTFRCYYTNKVKWTNHFSGHLTSTIRISPQILKYSTNPIEVPPPLIELPKEADIFGELGGLKYERTELDADELQEEERLKEIRVKVPRKFKPSPGQYADMIKNYIGRGDLDSAESVLAQCKHNKDIPTYYMYTLLIRAYAVQGNIKKCYQYYTEVRNRRYKIKLNVFTSLLNACANSPDSDKALDYLGRVREHMEKQQLEMNHAHFNVLVKAYGRHHKLNEANKIVQHMIDRKLKIGISTINSLMYAANSDTKSGLRHVLKYWQFMRREKIPPDMFTYNLLLKGIRDSHFGGCTMNELLLSDGQKSTDIVTDHNRPNLLQYPPEVSPLPFDNIQKARKFTALLEPPKSECSNESSLSTNKESLSVESKNLPASIANIDLDAVLKQNKLILFGGLDGFLKRMKEDGVEPNVKTLTYLMELVPNSTAAEEQIIKCASSYKINLDIDFYNMLIKKRALRGATKEAKDVLNNLRRVDLKPNIITYGVLALACTSKNESRDLLDSMKSTGHVINKYIVNTLLNSAIARTDFGFVLELMELMRYERMRVEDDTYERLDKFQKDMSELVRLKHRRSKKDNFKAGFPKFNMRYKSWQEDMGRKKIVETESKATKK